MNCLHGVVHQLHSSGSILLADIDVEDVIISASLISNGKEHDWLAVGKDVSVIFKETEVSLAKNLSGKLSIRNRLICSVKTIEIGTILSKVVLQFRNTTIESVVTTRAITSLELAIGNEVEALIKANEVSLMRN